MIYLWATLLVLMNAAWLFLVLLGLPGCWLMVVCTALLAWWQWGMFSIWTLAVVAALAAAGEVLEFFAGGVGVRKVGGTRWGWLGALAGGLLGGVVGTFGVPIPVFGSLMGACVGACLGAWSLELAGGKAMRDSAKAGAGAGVGRLVGTMVKLGIGALIWLIVAVAAYWP